jgi:plastocyanin
MHLRTRASAVAVSVLALSLGATALRADDDDKVPGSITVAFGAGLNTAQPGNTPNHHIIPQEFKVRITKARKLDGTVVFVPATVNFIVSGFHWPWVYNPGVSVAEIKTFTDAHPGLFVNYEAVTATGSNVFAKGVNPGTPPTFADRGALATSGDMNRTDSFGFSTPGRYLVICNVRGHFLDGMYAWVNVVDGDDKDN